MSDRIDYDSRGRPYYMYNGQRVYLGSAERDNSSTRHRVGSELSGHPGREPPRVSQSWPPDRPATDTRQRMTTGFPNTLFGGASQGSAPSRDASAHDPYRSAMSTTGPPRASPFNSDYNNYKDRDTAAEASGDQYKSYLSGNKAPSKKQRAAAPPGTYKGQPLGTAEFHATAGEMARNTSQLSAS
jgi:hypothetical protein